MMYLINLLNYYFMKQFKGRHSFSRLCIRAVLMVVWIGLTCAQESLLEDLGFETWEDPTEEEIAAQYSKLSQAYAQKQVKQPEDTASYEKASAAFRKLKQANFKVFPNSNRNEDVGQHQSRDNYKGRGGDREQHHYRSSYRMKMNGQFDINLDDFLQDPFFFTEDLFQEHGQTHGFGETGSIKLDISLRDFVSWLLQNPIIFISTILISIGMINLCIFCCKCLCCCCSTADREDGRRRQKESQRKIKKLHKEE